MDKLTRRSRRARKAALAAMIGAPLAVTVGSAALADAPQMEDFSVKAGPSMLMNSDAKSLTKENGIALGLTMNLHSRSLLNKAAGVASVDLDYITNSRAGNKIDVWGLSYTERVPFSHKMGGVVPYFGLGVGIFNDRVQTPAGSYVGPEGVGTAQGSFVEQDRETRIGGKALLGVAMGQKYYAELSYSMSGKAKGFTTDSLGLALGVRF
jgi:hypothetical protein